MKINSLLQKFKKFSKKSMMELNLVRYLKHKLANSSSGWGTDVLSF